MSVYYYMMYISLISIFADTLQPFWSIDIYTSGCHISYIHYDDVMLMSVYYYMTYISLISIFADTLQPFWSIDIYTSGCHISYIHYDDVMLMSVYYYMTYISLISIFAAPCNPFDPSIYKLLGVLYPTYNDNDLLISASFPPPQFLFVKTIE